MISEIKSPQGQCHGLLGLCQGQLTSPPDFFKLVPDELVDSAIAVPQATMMRQPMITDPIEIAAAYLFYLCRTIGTTAVLEVWTDKFSGNRCAWELRAFVSN